MNATCNISLEILWVAGLVNIKDKGMTICYTMNRCLVMVLKGGKVNVVHY